MNFSGNPRIYIYIYIYIYNYIGPSLPVIALDFKRKPCSSNKSRGHCIRSLCISLILRRCIKYLIYRYIVDNFHKHKEHSVICILKRGHLRYRHMEVTNIIFLKDSYVKIANKSYWQLYILFYPKEAFAVPFILWSCL